MNLEKLTDHLVRPTVQADFLNNLKAVYLVNQHISFFFYRASQSNFLFKDSYL
jgi:hypothetical protein